MAAQQCWHLSFMSTWIFVLFFLSAASEVEQQLHLNNTVFVALKGEDFYIDFVVTRPSNESSENLTCYHLDHETEKFSCEIPRTIDDLYVGKLKLNNLRNGEYVCEYQKAMVYWFLRVRNEPFKEPKLLDKAELIVAVFTVVLLVFSVVGSVYVFRGHWLMFFQQAFSQQTLHQASFRKSSLDTLVQESITECGKINRKRKQNREERKESEKEEDNVDVTATSCYASLEPRPRSIYDVLNHSAANTESDQTKAEPKDETAQTTESQCDDVFESVYENF